MSCTAVCPCLPGRATDQRQHKTPDQCGLVDCAKISPVTQPLALFKTFCLQMAAVLTVLLALGPFLHAHYGGSKTTGLHLAGLTVVSAMTPVDTLQPQFTPDDEPESAAVGVETSYARQISLDVQDEPTVVLILTVLVLATGGPRTVRAWVHPHAQRARRPIFLAGFPPLPHAPPALTF
jgi:hypothetical protein